MQCLAAGVHACELVGSDSTPAPIAPKCAKSDLLCHPDNVTEVESNCAKVSCLVVSITSTICYELRQLRKLLEFIKDVIILTDCLSVCTVESRFYDFLRTVQNRRKMRAS